MHKQISAEVPGTYGVDHRGGAGLLTCHDVDGDVQAAVVGGNVRRLGRPVVRPVCGHTAKVVQLEAPRPRPLQSQMQFSATYFP